MLTPAARTVNSTDGWRRHGTSPVPDQRPGTVDRPPRFSLQRDDPGAGTGTDGPGRRDPRPVRAVQRPGPGAQPGPGAGQRGAIPGGPSQPLGDKLFQPTTSKHHQ